MDWQQALLSITTDPNLSAQQKIQRTLDLGLDLMGLAIGLVSQVEDDVYKVLYASSPGQMIEPGDLFSVAQTYCSHTLKANNSVGFHNAALSEIASHPCYSHFKLESYIGAPISVQGKVVGTVNFSAAAPRDPFNQEEFEFINALSKWLGANFNSTSPD